MEIKDLITTWAAVVGTILAIFVYCENIINNKTKKEISSSLLNWELPTNINRWDGNFTVLFDSIFGEKHLSKKCLSRSLIATIISFLFFSILFHLSGATGVESVLFQNGFTFAPILIVVFIVTINLLPDYISLLQTRLFLDWIISSTNTIKFFLLLALDFILSLTIFFACYFMAIFLLEGIFDEIMRGRMPEIDISRTFSIWLDQLDRFFSFDYRKSSKNIFILVSLSTTLSTSIWYWIYFIGGWTIRILGLFPKCVLLMSKIFQIEQKPVQTIRFAFVVIITLFFIVLIAIKGTLS
ncbi:MAG: hypothetical protein HQL69_22305 [Magnetococcales bacterium]|nr:hypothetical protein [Magnetococcales bacterium]